jgi:hypothetical protein
MAESQINITIFAAVARWFRTVAVTISFCASRVRS